MKIDFQRKIDYMAGIFICKLLSLFSKRRKSISPGVKPQKILIILLSEMGSLVLAGPMFDHLEKKYPESSIYVLLFEQNKEFLELLNLVPLKNVFTVSNSSIARIIADSIRILLKMRTIKIDTVIDCELFSRISSIYSFFCGAKVRAGFHPYTQEGLFRGDFINRPVLYNPYNHISQQFITLAEAVESGLVPTVKRRVYNNHSNIPSVKFDNNELETFSKMVENDFSQIREKKLILINPGGGLLPIRAWPLANYCHVAKDLIRNGYVVGIIGLKSDKKLAETILTHCGKGDCLDFTGYTKTVRELVMIFHFASLLITNDGGAGHFASLTSVPVITFYGPETPTLYGALSPNSYNFYSPISCSPCLTAYNHRNSPCDGNNLCLKNIKTEDVLEKAYEIISA